MDVYLNISFRKAIIMYINYILIKGLSAVLPPYFEIIGILPLIF
jgi:hypothetical protein